MSYKNILKNLFMERVTHPNRSRGGRVAQDRRRSDGFLRVVHEAILWFWALQELCLKKSYSVSLCLEHGYMLRNKNIKSKIGFLLNTEELTRKAWNIMFLNRVTKYSVFQQWNEKSLWIKNDSSEGSITCSWNIVQISCHIPLWNALQ